MDATTDLTAFDGATSNALAGVLGTAFGAAFAAVTAEAGVVVRGAGGGGVLQGGAGTDRAAEVRVADEMGRDSVEVRVELGAFALGGVVTLGVGVTEEGVGVRVLVCGVGMEVCALVRGTAAGVDLVGGFVWESVLGRNREEVEGITDEDEVDCALQDSGSPGLPWQGFTEA